MLTWWLVFTRDIRRERTLTTQQIATLHDVYTSPMGPIDPEQTAPLGPVDPCSPPLHRIRCRASPPSSEGNAAARAWAHP